MWIVESTMENDPMRRGHNPEQRNYEVRDVQQSYAIRQTATIQQIWADGQTRWHAEYGQQTDQIESSQCLNVSLNGWMNIRTDVSKFEKIEPALAILFF